MNQHELELMIGVAVDKAVKEAFAAHQCPFKRAEDVFIHERLMKMARLFDSWLMKSLVTVLLLGIAWTLISWATGIKGFIGAVGAVGGLVNKQDQV